MMIVVLENIYRHVQDGLPPSEAAIKGSSEITFAVVIVMTLTLVAVYAPFGFMSGGNGGLFNAFCVHIGRRCFDIGFCIVNTISHDVF